MAIFPNVGPMHSNITTPMHGAYVSIYVNDIAGIYLDSVLKEGPAVGTVDFPNGSLIVKQNLDTSKNLAILGGK